MKTSSILGSKSKFRNKHLVISKAPEMSLGGNNRFLPDFLYHIVIVLTTVFFKKCALSLMLVLYFREKSKRKLFV